MESSPALALCNRPKYAPIFASDTTLRVATARLSFFSFPRPTMVAATTMTVIKKKQMEQQGSSSAQKKRNSMLARERNAAIAAAEEAEEARLAAMHPARRTCVKALDVLGSTSIQTTLYLIFVLVFQFLGSSMRILDEFYVDKLVMDRLVENHFDSSHNTFESVRRIADIYEWGNNVLWPGLFADMGPCNGVSSARTE
mgnify:CR=1 FL=1